MKKNYRAYIDEPNIAPWIATYKLFSLLRKLNISIKHVMCRPSLGGGNRFIFDIEFK